MNNTEKRKTVQQNRKRLAACFLTISLLCTLLLSITSCGSKMNALPGEPMSNDTFHDAASSAPGDFDNNGYAFGTKNASFSYNTDSEKEEIYFQTAEGQEESKTAAAQTQRKIIYSSYYNIQTTQFEEAVAALDALCEKYGAYYERSDTYGNAEYGNRNGSYSIRVPVESYKAFRSEAGNIGTVVHSTENNEDVSEKYFDTEARLSSAKLREERLLDILSKAESLDNVLLLESELADVRYEIESLSGSLRRYDSLISYSTVNIDLEEVMKPVTVQTMPKTFGERLAQSVSGGFRDFGNNMENFIVSVSYDLPGILLCIVVLLILIFVVKAVVKKIRKKLKASAVPPTAAEPASDASRENDTNH